MGADDDGWTESTFMAELFRTHATALRHYLLRLTIGDRERAEDLLQETMLRIWRNLEKFDGTAESLRPLVFTVARRTAIDVNRARKARPTEIGSSGLEEAADDTGFEYVLDAQLVRRALRALSPQHRSVIVEVYFNGRTVLEVAQLQHLPLGTAKSRLYHATRNLRQALADFGYER